MSFQSLRDVLAGTYNPDQSIRQHAESSLYELSHQPGFLSSCLDLIADPQVESLVKLSTAINIKNIISQNWSNVSGLQQVSSGNNKDILISDEEKNVIKSKLMEIIMNITHLSLNNSNSKYEDIHDLLNLKKNQLLPILSTIINIDFRATNDKHIFLESVADMIVNSGNDFAKIYSGLYCLKEICRTFRWSPNKSRSDILDPIISKMFPVLIEISNSLLEVPFTAQSVDDKLSIVAEELHGELLKFIVKCFKFVTYYDLPAPLQSKEVCFSWVNLQLQIINKPLPPYILSIVNNDDSSALMEIKNSQWVKAKKWSFANLSNLFTKFGTPMNSLVSSSSSSKEKNYLEFKIFFLDDFVPEILGLYFQLITSWCNNELFLANSCLYYLILFLDNSIKINKLWKKFFKNNLEDIISKFLYPILTIKDSVLKLIEEDPMEYIHISMNIFDDDSGIHDMAALGLITTLAEVRESSALGVILRITHELLVSLHTEQETLQSAKKKEAAFKIIGTISHILVNPNNKFHDSLKGFLDSFVIPNLLNRYGFMRLRALDVLARFTGVEEVSSMFFTIYQGIMVNLSIFNEQTASAGPAVSQFISLEGEHLDVNEEEEDSLLPVQTQAALCLQSFLQFDGFRELISKDIVLVMQKLLSLSEKIDLDVISGVMQEIVEMFSEQLQPFGVDLMKNLSQQIINVFEEEEDPKSLNADKIMVVNGIMNTMITILLSFENSADSIIQLEDSFLFVVKAILDHHLDDFYLECFELIENSTFLSRKISPNMWKILMESIIDNNFKAHKNDSIIFTYLSELTPALNNYLNFGGEELINNDEYLLKFVEMLKIIFNNGYFADEQGNGNIEQDNLLLFNEVSTNLILTLKIKASQGYIGELLDMSITCLLRGTILQITSDDPQKASQFPELQYYESNPVFVKVFQSILSASTDKIQVNFINLIVSGLVYDVHTTLNLLIKYNFVFFFQFWFKALIPQKKNSHASLERVFDLKISALGLLSLLNNLTSEEFQKYQLDLIFNDINSRLIYVIEKLPAAINSLEKRRTEFDEASFDYDAEDQKLFENQFHGFGGANDDDGDENDDNDDWLKQEQNLMSEDNQKLGNGAIVTSGDIRNGEFIDFLKSEREKLEVQFNDDDYEDYDDDEDDLFFDDEITEDPLASNPLDTINIFAVVKESLNHLEQADNAKYQAFSQSLTESQVAMLQAIFSQT
ncbi:Nmd5 protein [Saccharomycopsis crataegensis]|uniref:Nmd5 protein n=1 Tax=Saccharomycopsis crataegensis TaxID=43959 RepID=A0AAV5QE22_9ASCO|nr:Nmd5 protein [Saccharomycopsis crataegensis]